MGKYENLAKSIVTNVGGKENIISINHCITRLRFVLKDEAKANDDVLKNMDGVVTVMKAGGQYQVVIGNHVPEVYKDVCAVAGVKSSEKSETPKMSFGEKVLDLITGIFMPSMSLLCACGIIQGVLTLCTMAGVLTAESGLYQILNAAGQTMFYFFPIVIGFNAAKKFGGNPYLGMMLGAGLVYPAIQGVDLVVFGMTVNASYSSTVFPIILLCALAVPFEKILNKFIPNVVKTFVTPVIVLMVCLPIGFCIIEPAANMLSNMINGFFAAVNSFSPILAGAAIAGLWQILVMFGVHNVVVMTFIVGILAGVPQPLMGAVGVVCFVQTGATMAIWAKTKNQKLKNIALPAWISGIFGVTEPAIYGVTLPHGKQFTYTCVVAAIMGGIASVFGLTMYSMAGLGVFGIPGMINPENPTGSLVTAVVFTVASVIAGFVVAFLTFKEAGSNEPKIEEKKTELKVKKEVVASPLTGKVVPLTEVKDEAFSGELLGKGVAVDPTEGNVVAPCDGTVTTLFPTKHAIGIVTENGAELLIHLGLDTVKLEGEHFTAHIAQGDKVKKGQLMVTVDLEAVKAAGYSMVTPIIVTNTPDYLDIVAMSSTSVNKEEELLTLIN